MRAIQIIFIRVKQENNLRKGRILPCRERVYNKAMPGVCRYFEL
jgi:hypothetical protein